MSTWAQLRQEILFALDTNVDASTSSDIRNQVDLKLTRKRDEIYGKKPPKSLFVASAAVTITSAALDIGITAVAAAPIHPSFALSNYWRPFALTIEGEDWEPVEYDTWIRNKSAIVGDQRPRRSWTIDVANNLIYLKSVPSGSESWSGVLYYFKLPAAIVDGGIPEVGVEHESLLVLSVIAEFQDRFTSDQRVALYRSYADQLISARKAYYQAGTFERSNLRLRPYTKRKGIGSSVFWGTGESS
jgi:hypothetical protein